MLSFESDENSGRISKEIFHDSNDFRSFQTSRVSSHDPNGLGMILRLKSLGMVFGL